MITFTYIFSFIFPIESSCSNIAIIVNFIESALARNVILILKILKN